MVSRSAVVCLAILAAVSATDVEPCSGKEEQDLSKAVQLNPCKKLPCKLKKGTNQHIIINFTPETNYEDVTNKVKAELLGIPLPFVGVDGTSICDKIYNEAGEKVSCPLTAGTTYTYKDSFPILSFYPSTGLKVLWSLHGANKKNTENIICFHVPARIV